MRKLHSFGQRSSGERRSFKQQVATPKRRRLRLGNVPSTLAGIVIFGAMVQFTFAPRVIALATGCEVKGNISHNADRKIFHVPGQRDYHDVIIDPMKGEKWFCSEDEARAAGWVKAPR